MLSVRLETDRAVVRPYEAKDAEQLDGTIAAIRESLLPWLPWAREAGGNPERTLWWILDHRRRAEAGDLSMFPMGVFDRQDGSLIGGSGLARVRVEVHAAETGYWVHPARRGEGLCGEFTARVISWALRPQEEGGAGLRRVEIFCAAANMASRRVPEKLGLRLEVRARENDFVAGVGLVDRLGWGVLAEEWDGSRHAVRAQPGAGRG